MISKGYQTRPLWLVGRMLLHVGGGGGGVAPWSPFGGSPKRLGFFGHWWLIIAYLGIPLCTLSQGMSKCEWGMTFTSKGDEWYEPCPQEFSMAPLTISFWCGQQSCKPHTSMVDASWASKAWPLTSSGYRNLHNPNPYHFLPFSKFSISFSRTWHSA